MSKDPQVEELRLEFFQKNQPNDPHSFPQTQKTYFVLRNGGVPREATFNWEDACFREDLLRLNALHPDDLAVGRIGKRLREFLDTADWVADEEVLEKARKDKRPVHLTIKSHAPEVYHLPWELLPLRNSGALLCEIPELLIRYEWPRTRSQDAGQKTVRILLAASPGNAGVPFGEHQQALSEACTAGADARFAKAELRLLANASRRSLTEALNDPAHPIDVLHLVCHGTRMKGDIYGLMLTHEDREEGPDCLSPPDIQRLISAIRLPPRLVVLCVCQSSATETPAHLLGSLAQTFHRTGTPAVIASSLPVSGNGSILFTQAFYGELLGGSGHLRPALVAVRQRLFQHHSLDWATFQLYAREGDEAALDPLRRSTASARGPSQSRRGVLVRLCHEAYGPVHTHPDLEDMPTLLDRREVRDVRIDQTSLQDRKWERLEDEVRRLLSPEGELQQLLKTRDLELVYYGFPYIPLAALVGFLANTRPIHVVEYDRELQRFTWMRDAQGSFPPLSLKRRPAGTGKVARLRLSISATVGLEDCVRVLPASEVGLDLHFTVNKPQRGLIRREAQLNDYIQKIRAALDRYVAGTPRFEELHVFASVPVSIALRLGQALAATGLPICCVYNYGGEDTPRYKWRLWLRRQDTCLARVDVF